MEVITTTGLSAASALLGVEVVERKGAGHPDTLADGVAEAISRAYSRYCLDGFGAILHHNTDKTSLLGGAAHVRF
jgi:S-adenosylmethionine synthetase